MFAERRQEPRHIVPRTPRTAAVSVVEPRPRVLTPLLNTALNTATQLMDLSLIRRRIRLEHAKAATARAEAAISPPTLQPPGDLMTRKQEFPWTFILLGGGALMLILFLSKK